MSNSIPYDFGLLGDSTFPTSAPTNLLAGFNSNYSGLMPGGSFSSFGSGFDLNQISKLDPGAQMLAISAFKNDPIRQIEAVKSLWPMYEASQKRQAEYAQRLGLQSNLWGAAIKSIADLPKTIAQSAAQVRQGRLAGQQAILDQAQRPYNISGFNMPYTSYRV